MDKDILRNILESDKKEVVLSLQQFIQWFEESDSQKEYLDMFEQAMEDISKGATNPKVIAQKTLNNYRGED